jgi:hypothetical protein
MIPKSFENPADYLSAGPRSAECNELLRAIQSAGDEIIAQLPARLTKWDHSVQDASYLKALVLDLNDEYLAEIRFSQYGRLAVITNEDMVPENTLEIIRNVLRSFDFNYVSETDLGEPFRRRTRMNGDWFHRFFDYE